MIPVYRTYKVLICDLVGLRPGADGAPDCSEVRQHVIKSGCAFHERGAMAGDESEQPVHFYYKPELSTAEALTMEASVGDYDAVIAAATIIPADAKFHEGGVRIGAGTDNMQSTSWGGIAGSGGEAPLMNTPGINSRATAQMVMKAILRFLPDLPFEVLHEASVAGRFDTGNDLHKFSTEKLEGKRIAVLGYGNIGREVARVADAFGMHPIVYAREHHRRWIESAGFKYAATPLEAAADADLLSVHLGLGSSNAETGSLSNVGLINKKILDALRTGATLINFDRGELVDTAALDVAMTAGKVRFAAIDADVFKGGTTSALSGPLVPYIKLAKRHKGRLLLLPHAVADTDHPSRVAGAKQAVDQIIDAMLHRRVANVRGDVPPGYTAIEGRGVPGIGAVNSKTLLRLASEPALLSTMMETSEILHDFWSKLAASDDEKQQQTICEGLGENMLLKVNEQVALFRKFGLQGLFHSSEGS